MSNSLNRKAIESRLAHLAELEETARPHVLFSGVKEWILGDAIRATLADVRSLLDAASGDASRPIVDSLIGTLRAHGHTVFEPGERVTVGGDDSPTCCADTTPAPAPEPARNEPARLASEWEPSAAQIREYASKLVMEEKRVAELVAAFRAATNTANPELRMKRWGKTFIDWAEAQP